MQQDVPPFFTLLLTTCDRPALLRDALYSVLAQSGSSFEIILVDDGAVPDFVPELLRDPRVVYVNKRHHSRGVAGSRNIGMALARGRYLCFLDDDDLLAADCLAWMQAACEQHPGCAVFGNFHRVEERLENGRRIELSRTLHSIAGANLAQMQISNFIPMGAIALPWGERLPRFDETLASHEDWEFLLRCLQQFDFVGLDRIACEVRQRAAQDEDQRNSSRRAHHWLDFLAVYQRHPRRDLAALRASAIQNLHGVQLPLTMLENIGRYRGARDSS